MKKLIIFLIALGFEFQSAFAGFPCCRWIMLPNGQWVLQEVCEGVSCDGMSKPTDGAMCCHEACENSKNYVACYHACTGGSGGLGC